MLELWRCYRPASAGLGDKCFRWWEIADPSMGKDWRWIIKNEEWMMGYERTFVGVSEAWNLPISARSQIDRNNLIQTICFCSS